MQDRIDNRSTKEIFPGCESIIDYCFTINETDYFEFNDVNEVPNARGFEALSFYREYAMRCDRNYLLDHVKAVQTVIDSNVAGVKLSEIITLNNQLKERLEMLHEPNIAYKLMGVVIFDATENPNKFEYKKCIQKADIFQKYADKNTDFFLQKPIVRLIPCIDLLVSDFPEFCRAANVLTIGHLENIFRILSEANKSSEFYSDSALHQLKESL